MTSVAPKLLLFSGISGAKKGSFILWCRSKIWPKFIQRGSYSSLFTFSSSTFDHYVSLFVSCKTFSFMIFVPWTTQENVNTIKHSVHFKTMQNDPTPSHEKCSTLFRRKKRGLWRISSEYFEVSLIKREGGGGQAGTDVWSFNELTNWLLTDMRNMVNTHPNHTHTPLVSGERSIACALSESAKVWVPNTAADRSDVVEVWLQTLRARKGISWRSRRSKL